MNTMNIDIMNTAVWIYEYESNEFVLNTVRRWKGQNNERKNFKRDEKPVKFVGKLIHC